MQRAIFGPLLAVLLACAPVSNVMAVGQVVVVGLFKDKAVVRIDGRQRLLVVGRPSPEGVTLISADSSGAVLEVDGRRVHYGLDSGISSRFAAPKEAVVQIWPDSSGAYLTDGSINGTPVRFMVDTGANVVALSAPEALRLGIDFRSGTVGSVRTASGVAQAYRIKLDSVKVGEIEMHSVDAVVLPGAQPQHVLLGMSFLQGLKIENQGRAMVLKQLY
jgi:aspartyl protease family protein